MSLTVKSTLRLLAGLGLILATTGCGLDTQGLFTKGLIPASPMPPDVVAAALPAPISASASPAAPSLEFVLPLDTLPGFAEDKDKKNPSPGDPKSIARGKDAFDTNCAVCHGDKGVGNGTNAPMLPLRPRNLTQGVYVYGGEDWQLYRTIAEGIPPGPMLAWKAILADEKSDQGIWDVVNYVKTLRK